MDILGPLHESSSANKYVLVLVDQFTKWMEMFPLPNQNTITVAKRLLDGFISRLGCPVQIHTDQGKNLMVICFMIFADYYKSSRLGPLHIDRVQTDKLSDLIEPFYKPSDVI